MVDFTKQLNSFEDKEIINPEEIYEQLDRASDKGPLRPAQKDILNNWYTNYQNQKDTIIKLHTGQGKTLIGLLILQSHLNKTKEPVLYLCPNKHLVSQTVQQAKEFGINCCILENGNQFPESFLNGESILVTHIQVLFNGLTKFGLDMNHLKVSMLVLDDSHACVEAIRSSTKFGLTKQNSKTIYRELFNLFKDDLKKQGEGTFIDLESGSDFALLPVPYWAWKNKISEVTKILGKGNEFDEIKFVWPILKDELENCDCYVSNKKIEIIPYQIPIGKFGSFNQADNRVFMSATTNDDSILIKDLGLSLASIEKPLTYESESWSGEKMILFPSQISETLDRTTIVQLVCSILKQWDTIGKVVLVPSFARTKDWESYGSKIVNNTNLNLAIDYLKSVKKAEAVVFANRYDGIDLPDNDCRILVLDSLPYFETLEDRYLQSVLPDYYQSVLRQAQKIEQGFGRSVRGEKDYSAIVIIGDDLVPFLKTRKNQNYLSQQMKKQIDTGKKISELAKADIDLADEALNSKKALVELLRQLLNRDDGWKRFYKQSMDEIVNDGSINTRNVEKFALEKEIDDLYQQSQIEKVCLKIQQYIDTYVVNDLEAGWFFQKMAKYQYPFSKIESQRKQTLAHRKNSYLLMPEVRIKFKKMDTNFNWNRSESIKKRIRESGTFDQFLIDLNLMLGNLSFGCNSDHFEQSLDSLGTLLGFETQRPDKQWKEGPDNLWLVGTNEFLLFECKNEVKEKRKAVYKSETGQINNSIAWFKKNYNQASLTNILIINTKHLDKGAGFSEPVRIMREGSLYKLKQNVKNFFLEFKEDDFENLSESKIQERLIHHNLTINDLKNIFSEVPTS